MSLHIEDGSRIVARVPNHMSPLAEFMLLHRMREAAWSRMADLAASCGRENVAAALGLDVNTGEPLPAPDVTVSDAATLPRSGLVQAAPGVLLFKGRCAP